MEQNKNIIANIDWDLKEEALIIECDFICQCERIIYGFTTINYYEPYDG